jgi:putative peptide zinc metalloprotease protein
MRKVVALALALVLAGGIPAAAQDNTAVAVNTRDGADVFRLAFSIRRVMSDTVDIGNAAVAVSSCTDCRTVAIAMQVVLIFSDPEVVAPENLALAMNIECSLCDTLASAYQLVLTTDGVVRLTGEGHRRIAEIRRKLLQLRHSDLSGAELQAQIDAVYDELAEVIATELEPVPAKGPLATTTTVEGTTTSTSTTSTTVDPTTTTTTTTTTTP